MFVATAIVLTRITTFNLDPSDPNRYRVPIALFTTLTTVFVVQAILELPILHWGTYVLMIIMVARRVTFLLRNTKSEEQMHKRAKGLAWLGGGKSPSPPYSVQGLPEPMKPFRN